jgi:hypothetical protein
VIHDVSIMTRRMCGEQEDLPKFAKIESEQVIPGIKSLATDFQKSFQQLEAVWKDGSVRL